MRQVDTATKNICPMIDMLKYPPGCSTERHTFGSSLQLFLFTFVHQGFVPAWGEVELQISPGGIKLGSLLLHWDNTARRLRRYICLAISSEASKIACINICLHAIVQQLIFDYYPGHIKCIINPTYIRQWSFSTGGRTSAWVAAADYMTITRIIMFFPHCTTLEMCISECTDVNTTTRFTKASAISSGTATCTGTVTIRVRAWPPHWGTDTTFPQSEHFLRQVPSPHYAGAPSFLLWALSTDLRGRRVSCSLVLQWSVSVVIACCGCSDQYYDSQDGSIGHGQCQC